MLGSANPPQNLMSNESSYDETSIKKIIQKQEELACVQESTLQRNMVSPKDQNTESRTFEIQNKASFREKLKVLKRKKESFKKALSNLERGPKRIMRKCMTKSKKTGNQKQEQDFNGEEQSQEFDSNDEDDDENYTGTTHLKQQGGLDQNSLYHLHGVKKSFLKKRTLRFHANSEIIFPIPEGFKYHFTVTRQHEGAKYFAPEFQLVDEEKESVIYCKKMSIFEFCFSLRPGEWTEDSDSYIGRLNSNITGSILNFHIKIVCKQGVEQRVICTIEYTNSYFAFKKPRKIQVFMLDLTRTNLEDKKYQNISSLRDIYEKDLGNSNIIYFQNKYPTYNKIDKVYSLDFHGRAPVCSIKNFILEQPTHKGRQYLLFGKREENTYNLDFMHPFSLLNAFVVAISNFNGKIICE